MLIIERQIQRWQINDILDSIIKSAQVVRVIRYSQSKHTDFKNVPSQVEVASYFFSPKLKDCEIYSFWLCLALKFRFLFYILQQPMCFSSRIFY